MEESILISIKNMLGPDSDYDVFDNDIVMQINSAISVLTQLGVGPDEGFIVTGPDETWDQFLSARKDIEMAKNFVYMKVKMIFDPPANSFVLSNMKESCDEIGWRLSVATDKSAI